MKNLMKNAKKSVSNRRSIKQKFNDDLDFAIDNFKVKQDKDKNVRPNKENTLKFVGLGFAFLVLTFIVLFFTLL